MNKKIAKILGFEERPFPVGPEGDGSFNREDQLVEVGMPEMNNIPLKEGLLMRPYYLGKEEHFMPDAVKYPAMHKMLKPQFTQYPEVEKALQEEVEPCGVVPEAEVAVEVKEEKKEE